MVHERGDIATDRDRLVILLLLILAQVWRERGHMLLLGMLLQHGEGGGEMGLDRWVVLLGLGIHTGPWEGGVHGFHGGGGSHVLGWVEQGGRGDLVLFLL